MLIATERNQMTMRTENLTCQQNDTEWFKQRPKVKASEADPRRNLQTGLGNYKMEEKYKLA